MKILHLIGSVGGFSDDMFFDIDSFSSTQEEIQVLQTKQTTAGLANVHTDACVAAYGSLLDRNKSELSTFMTFANTNNLTLNISDSNGENVVVLRTEV